MGSKREFQQLIRTLEQGDVWAECPCCSDPMRLKDAGLFHLDDFSPEAEELYKQCRAELRDREKYLRERRKSMKEGSEVGAKAVNIGFILERLAPTMQAFRFELSDCRSIFDPIDYVIFEGLTKKGRIERLFFIDIKTGTSRLTQRQREIRALIENNRLDWGTYQTGGQA